MGHWCKKEFNILLVNEDDIEEEGDNLDEAKEKEETMQLSETVQISLNSLVGLSTPGTMKMRGSLKGKDVVILVDYGASHNFISHDLVQCLGIPITKTSWFGVDTGTRDSVWGKWVCKDVVLILQELIIVESFLPLDLGTTNVVLGMQWLSSVGRMDVDWNRLEMRIKLGHNMVVLKGDLSLCRSGVTLRSMIKTLEKGFHIMMLLVHFRRSISS